jgi:hypothetical protein
MYSSMHCLTLALNTGEKAASNPSHSTPGKKAPGTKWIGDWEGPRACVDAMARRKNP